MTDDVNRNAGRSKLSRRQFIGVSCTALSGSVVVSVSPALAAAAIQADLQGQYPVVDVTTIDAVADDNPIYFAYPDTSSPAMLIRLRQAAPGGVGPDNRIVAYSRLCTHKGCPVSYRPERKLFICPCHWSSFDPSKNGQMVIGQGSQALPQVTLQLRGRLIQAVGMTGLVYGRETNIL